MALFNIIVLIVFCLKTIKRCLNQNIKLNDIKFTSALSCAIIAVLSMIFPRPTPAPIVVIGVISFIFSLSFAYSIAYSDFNRIEHYMVRDRFTLTTLFFCVTISTLGYLNGENLVYFIENEPFKPTTIYYAYQYISYGFMLWLEVRLARVYLGNILRYKNMNVRIRSTLIFMGWCVTILCFSSIIINLILSHIGINIRPLNNFFHSMKGFAALFIALGELSLKPYNKLVNGIANKIDNILQEQENKIHQLHSAVVSIVPVVQLPDRAVREIRIMAELGTGCRAICTNIPHPKRVSSAMMAEYIFDNKDNVLEYGSYSPLQKIFFPKLYYLLVYRHLHRMFSTSTTGDNIKWINK